MTADASKIFKQISKLPRKDFFKPEFAKRG